METASVVRKVEAGRQGSRGRRWQVAAATFVVVVAAGIILGRWLFTKPAYGDLDRELTYQLLGKIIEAVTGQPLQEVYAAFFFRPLKLQHTWLVGRSEPLDQSTGAPADIFYQDRNITQIGPNGANWADGGILSTPQELVVFLRALNRGQILRPDTLELMHRWHPLRNLPFQYGYGTMRFALPAVVNWVLQVPPVWGHLGSTGSFLFYAPDLDLYMAGTTNQVNNPSTPLMLMIRVMNAVRQLR